MWAFGGRNNQDSHTAVLSPDAETFQTRGHLFIVADGMGGHAVGELASQIAVETIPHVYFKNRTDDIPAAHAAILDANTAVHEKGSQNLDFNRMGTTAVALVLGPKGAVVGHVGDSRLYRIRREQIDQLTFDHSLEWELIRHGRMKPNDQSLPEIKHVITRSIGPEAEVEPEVEGPIPVWANDTFLLCSDGLTGLVKDAEIGRDREASAASRGMSAAGEPGESTRRLGQHHGHHRTSRPAPRRSRAAAG